MTEGLLVSAHRAQGQHPSEGCCPPGGWVRPRKHCARLAHSNPPARRDPVPSWPVGFVAQGLRTQTHPPGGIQSPPGRGIEVTSVINLGGLYAQDCREFVYD